MLSPNRSRPRRLARLLPLLAALALCPVVHAQLGARTTEQWLKTLESDGRIRSLKVDEVVGALKLAPGTVVADIGAGAGAFSFPLAKAVSPTGKVYAVDIDPGLVDHIAAKAKEQKVNNVVAVLGQFTDPTLPAHDVDLAFICDVLHHIENRAGYLKNLQGYLKPTGRIAVVDFYPELGPHRKDPKLQVTKDETKAWMAAIGLKPIAEHRLFKEKWFVIYGR